MILYNELFSKIVFLVNHQSIAALGPWPCGFYSDSLKRCTCAPAIVTKYQKRISGPLLDHVDIHIEVPRVDYEKLSGDRMGETSESFASVCRRYAICNLNDLETEVGRLCRPLSATPICASGRLGNFVACRMKAFH